MTTREQLLCHHCCAFFQAQRDFHYLSLYTTGCWQFWIKCQKHRGLPSPDPPSLAGTRARICLFQISEKKGSIHEISRSKILRDWWVNRTDCWLEILDSSKQTKDKAALEVMAICHTDDGDYVSCSIYISLLTVFPYTICLYIQLCNISLMHPVSHYPTGCICAH